MNEVKKPIDNLKLYVHWVYCLKEKCNNFNKGCGGSSDLCANPTFLSLENVSADQIAALEKTDSYINRPDVLF